VALLVAAVATVWVLVLTFPLVLHLSSGFYGRPGDASGTIAVYWWWSYALQHGLNLFDNSMLGGPLGSGWQNLAFTVLDVAIMAPLSLLLGPVLAYNLQNLVSFPLTAAITYLLAREAGASRLGSAFAGLALAFIPYHLEKAMGHVTQTHLELFAGSLLLLLRWRRTRQWRYVVLSGLLLGITMWWDPYYVVILSFLIAAFFLLDLLVPPAPPTPWRPRLTRWLGAAGLMSLIAVAFVPLALLAIHRPGSGSGVLGGAAAIHRPLVELQYYTARWREYLLPWHANPLVPQGIKDLELRNLHTSNFTEQSLFLGYTVMTLGLVGLWFWRRSFAVAACVLIAVVGAAMATPPFMRPLGLFSFHGPSYYLNSVLPFLRVYARFAVLVMLGVCVLAGLGFTALQQRLPSKAVFLAALPFVLLAIEFNNVPPSHVTVLFPAPAAYTWLRSQPPGILVEYPLAAGDPPRQEEQNHQYMAYQQVHLHPLFNGAEPSSPAAVVATKMEPFYGDSAYEQLHTLGIRYLFVHRSDYQRDGYLLPKYVVGLTYQSTMEDIDIYTVTNGG
jgi:hypothetical protein